MQSAHYLRRFDVHAACGAHPTVIDCFASLAMTYNARICHCKERSDEAISTLGIGEGFTLLAMTLSQKLQVQH